MPPNRSVRSTAAGAAAVGALVASLVLVPAAPAAATPGRPALPTPALPTPALVRTNISVPATYRSGTFATKRSVRVPAGWTVSVWARREAPRLMVLAPDGRMLVSRPSVGKVTRLTPHGAGRATSRTLISKLRKPHGLAFDGSTLYVAESNRIDRYTYTNGKVGKRHTVLKGLPDKGGKSLGGAYAHALKSLAVGPDHALYVSIGSTENASAYDRSTKPQRAAILRIAKGARTATVFARGVRNGTGLAVAPDGALWTAVNNRDNVRYPYHRDYDGKGDSDDFGDIITSYVNDHPIEPLARLTQGRDLGWPYCNPDPDVTRGVLGSALAYDRRPFVNDIQTNRNGTKLRCSALTPLEQGLPAHSAPLGLSFTRTDLPGLGAGALVGVHGSWNRRPPRAPEVAFFPYAGGALGGQRTVVSGFQNAAGKRWGRPVAAVQGRDGALYVSDDLADAVYRVAPPA